MLPPTPGAIPSGPADMPNWPSPVPPLPHLVRKPNAIDEDGSSASSTSAASQAAPIRITVPRGPPPSRGRASARAGSLARSRLWTTSSPILTGLSLPRIGLQSPSGSDVAQSGPRRDHTRGGLAPGFGQEDPDVLPRLEPGTRNLDVLLRHTPAAVSR